jgi:hypothetical protein
MHTLALEGDTNLFQYVLKPQIDDHLKDVLKPKFGFQILDTTDFDDDPKTRPSRFILYVSVHQFFFNFHFVWMSSFWILIHLCPIRKIKKLP